MIDRDLAEMYGVETRRLNEQVKPNEKRFPDDFMFSFNRTRIRGLKVAFCDIQSGEDGFEKIAECIHPTRCSHALKCFEKRNSDSCKYQDNQSVYQNAGGTPEQQGYFIETRKDRKGDV